MNKYIDKVFYKSSEKMSELPDNSVQVIVTSPPYFNIKITAKTDTKIVSILKGSVMIWGLMLILMIILLAW